MFTRCHQYCGKCKWSATFKVDEPLHPCCPRCGNQDLEYYETEGG